MKLSVAAVIAAVAITPANASMCASELAVLLTSPYINTCSSDSGYSFISGVKPTEVEAILMCASGDCISLIEFVKAWDPEDCTFPLGDNILLRADLFDYVPTFCEN